MAMPSRIGGYLVVPDSAVAAGVLMFVPASRIVAVHPDTWAWARSGGTFLHEIAAFDAPESTRLQQLRTVDISRHKPLPRAVPSGTGHLTDRLTGRSWRDLVSPHLQIGLPWPWAVRYALAGVEADWLRAALVSTRGWGVHKQAWVADPARLLLELAHRFRVPGKPGLAGFTPAAVPDLTGCDAVLWDGVTGYCEGDDEQLSHNTWALSPDEVLSLFGCPSRRHDPTPPDLARQALSYRAGLPWPAGGTLADAVGDVLGLKAPKTRPTVRALYQRLLGTDIGKDYRRPSAAGDDRDNFDRMRAVGVADWVWPLLQRRFPQSEWERFASDDEHVAFLRRTEAAGQLWRDWLALAAAFPADLANVALAEGLTVLLLQEWMQGGGTVDRLVLLMRAGFGLDEVRSPAVEAMSDDDLAVLAALRSS